MEDHRLEQRKKEFLHSTQPTHKHERMAAELRRKKKADFFQEKRLKQIPPEVIITPVTILRDKALANFNPIFASPTSSKSDKIKAASDALDKPIDSPELLGHLAEFLRVCVSGNDADLLVGILVDVGLIPKLVALLEVPLVKVQFEASWALINISHSKYGEVVRKAGAHVKLSDLLDLSKLDICENAIWALGNMAGDCEEGRNEVLKTGALGKIINIMQKGGLGISMNRVVTWTTSVLLKYPHMLSSSEVNQVLNHLYKLIEYKDYEIAENVLNTYMNITEDKLMVNRELIEKLPLQAIAEYVESEKEFLVVPAIGTIGNICCYGTQEVTDFLLKITNLLDIFAKKLKKNPGSPKVLVDICWTLGNIACGASRNIQKLLDRNIFKTLSELAMNGSTSIDVKKEVLHCYLNASTYGTPEQARIMYEADIIEALRLTLNSSDTTLLSLALDSLEKFLDHGYGQDQDFDNLFTVHFESLGGKTMLEELEHHSNIEIHRCAEKLLDEYFAEDS